MLKSKAIELLGGTVGTAAEAIGVSPSAVSQWPEDLPPRLSDRVLAALARKHLSPELIGTGSGTALPPLPDAAYPADGKPLLEAAHAG